VKMGKKRKKASSGAKERMGFMGLRMLAQK
jgi:hypothetical protein